MNRTIIHINITDFAVAVERLCDSRLRQRPVIIAAGDHPRAPVHDMSEEAYREGVRKGMPLERARRFCRAATVLAPNPDRYRRAMAAMFRQAASFSPRTEITDANGHLFLDVSGCGRLFGTGRDIGWRLGGIIRRNLGLEPVWTLAANKLVAKTASRLVRPVGEYIVDPGDEERFLAPLPLRLLPGLDEEEKKLLAEYNIIRAGELARLSPAQLTVLTGRRGPLLHNLARGIDHTPVMPARGTAAWLFEHHAFAPATNDRQQVEGRLRSMAMRLGSRLRRAGRATGRLVLTVHFQDGRRTIRQVTSPLPTNDDRSLRQLADKTLARGWQRRLAIKSLTITCDRLTRAAVQLYLFDRQPARDRSLDAALDTIRRRHGETAISRLMDAQ